LIDSDRSPEEARSQVVLGGAVLPPAGSQSWSVQSCFVCYRGDSGKPRKLLGRRISERRYRGNGGTRLHEGTVAGHEVSYPKTKLAGAKRNVKRLRPAFNAQRVSPFAARLGVIDFTVKARVLDSPELPLRALEERWRLLRHARRRGACLRDPRIHWTPRGRVAGSVRARGPCPSARRRGERRASRRRRRASPGQ
jgi:hypothetical protein